MNNLSKPSIIEQFDELIAAAQKVEDELTEAGFSEAHAWMFNIREILYDLRRVHKLLVELSIRLTSIECRSH